MARPKAQELPGVEGPGIGLNPERHKDLDRLGDKFIEIREAAIQNQIDFWRRTQSDPYGIANAVIASLECVKHSLTHASRICTTHRR